MSTLAGSRTVVLIDDDADVRSAISQSLELHDLEVRAHASAESALNGIDERFAGVVVSDIRLPGRDGREVFRIVHDIDPEIPVILITGHGEVQEAVDLIRAGVYDFVSKPFSTPRLLVSVRNALEQRSLVLDNRGLRHRAPDDSVPLPLIGDSRQIRSLRNIIRELSATDVNVLIVGETGTGKESIAKAMHSTDALRAGSFVLLDCAALPDTLLDAELFGTESVVQGMTRRKPGRIEAANRGTLFLDNIDSLPLASQARLLRVVEDKEVTAVGASASRTIACRVLSAATRDVAQLCEAGLFRSDLYFRVNTVTLQLPPLRERREDLAALLGELLIRASKRLGRSVPQLTRDDRNFLYEHQWPGNIRELAHFAERVVLGLERLPYGQPGSAQDPLPARVESFEESVIKDALRATRGDVKSTLALLQVPRKTFYDKVARYQIDLDSFRRPKS